MSEYIEFWTKFSKKSKEILKEYNNDYNYEVLLLFMLGGGSDTGIQAGDKV